MVRDLIGVVGAGQMGTGIAEACLKAGMGVMLFDSRPEALDASLDRIKRFLSRAAEKGEISPEQAEQSLSRVVAGTSLAAMAEAPLVIEAAPENAALKQKIFSHLDEVCQDSAVLASNTSSIPISSLAASTRRPGRVVGVHFMNPVPVMQLVEVIPGRDTSPAALKLVEDFCRRLGKTACRSRDTPGFIANRVLMPMINEAVLALEQGVADVETIDTVLKLGARHPMGPLELADFIGLDTCLAILQVLEREFKNPKYRPARLLAQLVEEGRLGKKTGKGFYDYAKPGR